MKRLMLLAIPAVCGFCTFAATSYEWTGKGAANDWTDANNYDPVGTPVSGDTVVIPSDTTVTLSATDTASWQVADQLKTITPEDDTATLEVNVPSGSVGLKCGVGRDNANNAGLLVKTGNGLLQFDKGGAGNLNAYNVSLRVDAGTVRAPTNDVSSASSSVYSYGKVDVKEGATFFVARCTDTSRCPVTLLAGLSGAGVVTNDTTYKFGGQVIVDDGETESVFSGTIGGRIRIISDGKLVLTGTNNTMVAGNDDVLSAGNNQGLFANGPMVSFMKLGNRGEPSSVGTGDLQFYSRRKDDSGAMKYLGTGETSDKNIILNGLALYPSLFDAGANGGLTLTGTIGISTSNPQNHTLILSGENATAAGVCTLSGPIADTTVDETDYAITNIVKRGAGTWRFADNAERTWSGRLTVEDGKVQFASLAATGTVSSLGTALNASPYSVLLSGGTFEYVGTGRQSATDRTLGVGGSATLRNASDKPLEMANVSAATDGAVLTLDGAEGTTNVLSDVTDGAGTLSVRKTGAGTWRLRGTQTFSGDLTVEDGTLVVDQPRYEWYRMSFRHTISNNTQFYANEIGLYDADGRRLNANMRDETEGGLENLGGDELYLYRKADMTSDAITNLFDDAATAWRSYQKVGTKSTALVHDDPSTWVRFVMRLGSESLPATSFDVVVGGSRDGAGAARSVDDYLLEASTDGLAWETVCDTNKQYVQEYVYRQWFFDGNAYENGDAAVHTTGCPIAARPSGAMPSQLTDCRVSVASGATLKARAGDTVTVSKLKVSATGAGTLDGVVLAANGTLDVTDVPQGVRRVELPISFVGTDPAAVANWTLSIDGETRGNWKASVEDGKIVIKRGGFLLLLK